MSKCTPKISHFPTYWPSATFDDLISANGVFSDGDWIETKDQDQDGDVRLIQLSDIGDGVFKDKSDRHLTFEKSVVIGCTYLSQNDLLIARLPDPLGRACLFPQDDKHKYVTAVDICIVRLNLGYAGQKYFMHLVNCPQIRAEIDKYKSGSTRKRISRKNLARIALPVAPLPEQTEIVSRIDQLFPELDNGIETLKTAQEQVKTYRQAVLKHAFEGKLSEEWREEQGTGIWKEMTLGEVIKVKSGKGLPKSRQVDTGQFLVYGGNGIMGKHDAYMFEEPSLIIGRVGVHCGNVHITKPKSWITDNAFVSIFDDDQVEMNYLLYFLSNLQLKKYSGNTAQPVISGGNIYPIDIKLPPKREQKAIVKEIESRLSVCDKLEQTIEDSLKKAEALRQSILKKAFSGELTKEWRKKHPELITGEHSAERLLERIKAEKAEFKADRKKRQPEKKKHRKSR